MNDNPNVQVQISIAVVVLKRSKTVQVSPKYAQKCEMWRFSDEPIENLALSLLANLR